MPELRLGHTAKSIVTDSLGAHLRRIEGTTLWHVAQLIRNGDETNADFYEAVDFSNNMFGVQADVLALCVWLAREAKGPIIEAGSGLTTIMMAAANPDHYVYCLEHSTDWADRTIYMAQQAGIRNIAMCHCPIQEGWYDLSEVEAELPKEFALGLVDGPPRLEGSRLPFFDKFTCSKIICDDADDPTYVEQIKEKLPGKDFVLNDGRALIIQ